MSDKCQSSTTGASPMFLDFFADDFLVNRRPEIHHDCLTPVGRTSDFLSPTSAPRRRSKSFPRNKERPKIDSEAIATDRQTKKQTIFWPGEKFFGPNSMQRKDLWNQISHKTPSPIKNFFGEFAAFKFPT